jgi:hypothetical protein
MCEYFVSRLRGVLCCRTPGNYDSVWVSTCTLDGCIVFHPVFLVILAQGKIFQHISKYLTLIQDISKYFIIFQHYYNS